MRFLLDVCSSSRSLRAFLDELNHDTVSIVEVNPSATDDEVLEIALNEKRALITEDKDFGGLVFVRGLAHGTIIRFCEMSVEEQVDALRELIQNHASEIESNSIITIRRGRIRIRQ